MSTLFGFTDPFADLLDMQRQMDRLMSAFTADVPSLLTTTATPVATMTGVPQPTTTTARARRWSPSLDVWETEQSIVLHAELPGCNLDDIKLSVTGDNRLVLEGHKRTAEKMEKKMKEERWVRRERFEGDFYRTLPLPAGVEASQIRADYANGVLEVVVPKQTRERGAKRQTIYIREGLGATLPLQKEVEQQPKVEKKRAEEEKTEEEEKERVEAQPPLQLDKKEEKMEQPPLEKKEEVEQPAEEGKQLEKEEEKMEQPKLKEEAKEEERVEAQPPQREKEEEEAKPTEEAKQTIETTTPAEETTTAEQPQVEEKTEEERAEAQPHREKKEEEERVEVQPPQQPQQVEMKEAKEEELVEAQQPPQVPAEKEVLIEPTEQMKPQQEEQQQEEKKPQQQQEEEKEKEGYTPTTQGERSIFIGEGEAH